MKRLFIKLLWFFLGRDITCDCGHDNDFTDEELDELEEAVEEENE
jgi:hypothetical protein